MCGLLVAGIALAFGQTAGFGFTHFDDQEFLLENPIVNRGLSWEGMRWAFTTGYAANWFPLTWLSHMLDCELFGLVPGAHHLVNVALHLVNSLLLFFVLARMTGRMQASALVAGLFAVHPLHVETVAWIAERKGLLAGLFWMLTLLCWTRYVERPGATRYLVVLGVFALGLMAKPVLVTLPFLLLLLDFWPFARLAGGGADSGKSSLFRVVAEKVPLIALAATSSAITYRVQQTGGAMEWAETLPFSLRFQNAIVSYARYVVKMVWPTGLAAPYPYPGAWEPSVVLVAACLLAAITITVFVVRRRQPAFMVGWFWFVGTLVPMIGLVQVGAQSMADRYTYLPGIGLFLIAAWGFEAVAEAHPQRRRWVTGVGVAVLTICTVLSYQQTRHWRNSVSLFSRAIAVTGGNPLAHYNLGQALRGERGATREALPHLREAIRISPTYVDAHWALGTALIRLGEATAGIHSFREAARLDPTHFRTRLDLGAALVASGDEEEAIAQLREAVKLQPDSALALNNLAWLLATASRSDLRDAAEAMSFARRACELTSNQDPGFLATLAVAQAEGGDWRSAVSTARAARERSISMGAADAAHAIDPMLEAFEARRPYDARAPDRL